MTDITSLPGYRPDRKKNSGDGILSVAPVFTNYAEAESASGPRWLVCKCGRCGSEYVRALGVPGRKREWCSDRCKDFAPKLHQFSSIVSEMVKSLDGNDEALLKLKAELLSELVHHSEFQRATGRLAHRAK